MSNEQPPINQVSGNWTKILASVFGALILALQGTNIVQGVAISSTESRIERVEDDLSHANLTLNKLIIGNQEEFRAKWTKFEPIIDGMDHKLDRLLSPSPTPTP
jgi:hypothetical protein